MLFRSRFGVPPRALQAALVLVCLMGLALTERQIATWSSRETLWKHVLAVDPGNAVALGKTAFAAAKRGNTDEAERLYLEALAQVEFPWVIAGLARLYHDRGDLARRDRYRDWAARVAPRDETVVELLRDLPPPGPAAARPIVGPQIQKLLEQGTLELNAGGLPEALAAFEAAIEADPSCAAAWNLAGIACVGLDRQPEAARHFQNAIRIDPGNFGYRVNLARVLSVLQDWPGCLAACREAMAIKPEDAELKTLFERARRKVGDMPAGDRQP